MAGEKTTCKVCKTTALSKPGICVACCKTLGIVPMPEITRPPRGCLRCQALKFVRVIPREFASERRVVGLAQTTVAELAVPMALTYEPHTARDPKTPANDLRRGHGMLEAWVCVSCDFVEWYCHDARAIPIGPEYMSEEVDFAPPSPYR